MDTIRRNSPEMARELNGEIDRNLQLFATMLPLPVEYNRDYTTIASSTAAVTSNANVFQTLLSLRPADFQPAPSSDIQIQIDGYQKLVEEQERAAEAGRRVARLF
ncbi:MAG: hypothetical protein JF611_04720, partial [Betaproteobacteria bacterium]|nr:hypothetical protein [Betaproteobacteria bacterium]